MSKSPADFDIASPFVVARASNEGIPWGFHFIIQGGKKVLVQTEDVYLRTADYSIVGYTDQITIERKSKSDFYGTVGRGRERFIRQLQRMTTFEFSCVIIEASRQDVFENPPAYEPDVYDFLSGPENGGGKKKRKVTPSQVIGSANAWTMDFGIPFIFETSRLDAEVLCYWLLDRWWKQQQEKEKKQ